MSPTVMHNMAKLLALAAVVTSAADVGSSPASALCSCACWTQRFRYCSCQSRVSLTLPASACQPGNGIPSSFCQESASSGDHWMGMLCVPCLQVVRNCICECSHTWHMTHTHMTVSRAREQRIWNPASRPAGQQAACCSWAAIRPAKENCSCCCQSRCFHGGVCRLRCANG